MKKSHFLVYLVVSTILCASARPSFAENAPIVLNKKDKLNAIAKQFVDKVGKGLENADDILESRTTPEQLKMQAYFDNLEDDEQLILEMRVEKAGGRSSDKIRYANTVFATKKGKNVFISLVDFIFATGFPIKIDVEKKTAKGWFVRENQEFDLDVAKKIVSVAGKTYKGNEKDFIADGTDILVKANDLAEWFQFDLVVNPQAQVMTATTYQLWPAQEKEERELKKKAKNGKKDPVLPFYEEPYKILTPPNFDVNLRSKVSKSPQSPAQTSSNMNLNSTGEFLGFSYKSNASLSQENGLENAYSTFSRDSEDRELLGPLKASHYEFADVSTVQVPGTGSSPIERGVRITNKALNNSFDAEKRIEGYATPGWDVELYRDDLYIAGKTIGDDGLYAFENVPLYAGDNKFIIIQYGPQGEVKQEERTVSVGEQGDTGSYDVSLSQQNTNTYSKIDSTDKDKGTPNFAATYEAALTDSERIKTGVRALQQEGRENIYGYTGFIKTFDSAMIANLDTVITSQGTYNTSLYGRRNFGPHYVLGRVSYTGENFSVDTAKANLYSPARYSANISSTGPLESNYFDFLDRATYTASIGGALSENAKILTSSYALSNRFEDILVNTGLEAEASFAGADVGFSDIKGFTALRGRALGFSWRATTRYDVVPNLAMESFLLSLSRKVNQDIDMDLDFRHENKIGYTIGTLGLGYATQYATISPAVSYDSNKNATASVNLRFSAGYNPYDHDIYIRGTGLTGKGSASAFVFLDKDGDGLYSKGDEPLQDVGVEAVQNNKTVLTNKSGEAYIYDLAPNKITDITVQESSTFDPNWASAWGGLSVKPRPGSMTRLEFPILRGGEIDGTVFVLSPDKKEKLPGRSVTVSLVTPTGKKVKQSSTEGDGYYLFDRIRPGVYYQTIDATYAPARSYYIPRMIVIGPEGKTLYGQNIDMKPEYDIPFIFSSLNEAPSTSRVTRVEMPDEIKSQFYKVRIGKYYSELLAAFSWYKLKIKSPEIAKFFYREKESYKDKTSQLVSLQLRPKEKMNLENMARLCEKIIDKGIFCAVEVVTEYKKEIPERKKTLKADAAP